MRDTYKDKAEFLLVYIREAHPDDGWQMPKNKQEGVIFDQPKTQGDRDKVAGACVKSLNITWPTVVDDMKDTVELAYGGWPERLFVADKDGKLIYRGGKGPGDFRPDEAERALRKHLGMPEAGGVVPAKGAGAGGPKGR